MAPVAGRVRIPVKAGVIRASGNLEDLEDGAEEDDTAEGVVTKAVVVDALEDGELVISSITDVS